MAHAQHSTDQLSGMQQVDPSGREHPPGRTSRRASAAPTHPSHASTILEQPCTCRFCFWQIRPFANPDLRLCTSRRAALKSNACSVCCAICPMSPPPLSDLLRPTMKPILGPGTDESQQAVAPLKDPHGPLFQRVRFQPRRQPSAALTKRPSQFGGNINSYPEEDPKEAK